MTLTQSVTGLRPIRSPRGIPILARRTSSSTTLSELVRLASNGRLDLAPSITDHIPLADAAEAIHRLEHKIGDPFRLILVP